MKKCMHVKPLAYIYLYYPGLIVSVDSMFACLITERMKKAKSNQKISFSHTFKVFIVIVKLLCNEEWLKHFWCCFYCFYSQISTFRCSCCCYSKHNVILVVRFVVYNYWFFCKDVYENYLKDCTNNHYLSHMYEGNLESFFRKRRENNK